jgi:hypothetical protein
MSERGPADAAGPLTLSDRPATRRDAESDAPMGLGQLDDDYPAITMGQAAELLEVQPAFLRSLDAAGYSNHSAQAVDTGATPGANFSWPPGCGSCSTKE